MILKIFQGFSLFSYQCSLFALLRQLDYFIKSLFVCQALFYFFELCFKFSVLRQLVYSIKTFCICQELFYFLLHICFKAKESAGGGIRTHAPLRTNGFQDRLVMTTSIPLHFYVLFTSDLDIISISASIVNRFLNFFSGTALRFLRLLVWSP